MSQPQQPEEEEFTGSHLKESDESKAAEGGTSEGGAKAGEEVDVKKESKRPEDNRGEESRKPTTAGPDSRVSKPAPSGVGKGALKGPAPSATPSKQADAKKGDTAKKDVSAPGKDMKTAVKGPPGKDAKKTDGVLKNAGKGPNAAKKAKKGCCNII